MKSRRLEGKVALITGASRGIGRALAVRMAAEGAAVGLVARTERPGSSPLEGSLAETVGAVEEGGGRAFAVAANLADPEDRARIVPAVREALGPVDVLVNNAAASMHALPSEIALRRRQISFEVNLHAPLDLAQAVLPDMRRAGRGWIVNLSSATASHPEGPAFDGALDPVMTIYGASKAALERTTLGLAFELKDDGIAVNAISPVAAVSTPGAEALVGELLEKNPELVEPVSWLEEAVVLLSTCDAASCTGRILFSGPFLDELGRKP